MHSRQVKTIALCAIVVAMGCTGETDTESLPCEGGGVASVVVGSEGPSGFEPFEPGDPVQITEDGAGIYSVRFDFHIAGVDTTGAVTANLRLWFDDDPSSEDYLGSATLSCQGEGPARYGAFATLPAELQSSVAVDGLDGAPLDLEAVFTDSSGGSASGSIALTLAAPGTDTGR